ncbi:dynein axonemal assembly factor 3-like [Macrobrachium nipponense]|uniref:dynein axonemal assembly factor 3-like n=1 Tax=Macrobrachium nipponense TaxID=159736 RepID=UPI0030C831FC
MWKMYGHGIFNWWGFSPASDLISYSNLTDDRKEYQLLLVGTGDHRHLLSMIAKRKNGTNLKIFIIEAHVELYARIILLLGVCLRRGLGLQERATLLLDLWGNLNLRPVSKDYLHSVAREYARNVTDASQFDRLVGIVAASKLKYKERDAMDDVFKSWYKLQSSEYDSALAWDARLRQFLKNRYDNRRGDADWAWHMRLSFRLDSFCPSSTAEKKTSSNNKEFIEAPENRDRYVGICTGWGNEFLAWRHTGHAFDLAVQTKSSEPNTSLASVAVFSVGLQKHRRVGYWGDILSGPFPATALAATNIELAKLQNGRSKYSGTEVAQKNTEYFLELLWKNCRVQDTVKATKKSFSLECNIPMKANGKQVNENSCTKEETGHRDKRHIAEIMHTGASDAQHMQIEACLTDTVNLETDETEETKRDFEGGTMKAENNDGREKQESFDQNIDGFQENQRTEGKKDFKINEEASALNKDSKPTSDLYISLEGVQIILLSPTRMNDLRNLPEINGYLDIVYLSAATAHLLNSTLAASNISAYTTILVESARMMPELTDDQVTEYETQITKLAKQVDGPQGVLHPSAICDFAKKKIQINVSFLL